MPTPLPLPSCLPSARLVLPAMLFLTKKIDMKDATNVQYAQFALIGVGAFILLIHLYVFVVLSTKKGKDEGKAIWVPPKPKPQLPFGLGPPPEPVKPEEFEHTTYKEYEMKLLRESAQGIVMSLGITMFMSIKFQVHVSLLMQSVMMPLNLLDSVVLKKYLLGTKGTVYNEQFVAPTLASLTAAAAAAAAASGETKEEPRVIELPAEEKKETKKDK